MPKHDFMTPKAIGNRQKSIGLQKLRWYCQMCQKQCRDENGFKCHTTSEGHLRQMRLFSENSHKILDEYSRDFEKGFLETLSHRHGTKRVLANRVYQEYIGDKHHVHMNSTQWSSLTGLCKHLGKEGKAVVDETEKGWYIQYIDRDPKLLARQLQAEERKQSEMDDEERTRRQIALQIAAAEARQREREQEESERAQDSRSGEGDRDGDEGGLDGADEGAPKEEVVVKLSLGDTKKRKLIGFNLSAAASLSADEEADQGDSSTQQKKLKAAAGVSASVASMFAPSSTAAAAVAPTRPMSQIELHMLEDERRRTAALAADDRKNRLDHWLHVGIVVKVVNKEVGEGRYYKLKGVVKRVLDKYVADVLVDGSLLRLDQEHLETVLPKVGGRVLIVNGRGRGLPAVVTRFHEEQFNCDLSISTDVLGGAVLATAVGSSDAATYNLFAGRELKGVEYEDICKLDE